VLIVQHRDFSRFKYVARLCDLVTGFSKKLDGFVLIVQHRDFSRFKYVARLCDLVTGFGKKLIHDLF